MISGHCILSQPVCPHLLALFVFYVFDALELGSIAKLAGKNACSPEMQHSQREAAVCYSCGALELIQQAHEIRESPRCVWVMASIVGAVPLVRILGERATWRNSTKSLDVASDGRSN